MKPPLERDPWAPFTWAMCLIMLAVLVAVGWVGR